MVRASGHDDSTYHRRCLPMYSIGIAKGNSKRLAQTCLRWTVTMKPGGLAQCLPVVSATGIQGNEAQRPEGPTQLFSWPPGSGQTPITVSARWALSVAWNPPPVADTTGRHSIGPPGLRHIAQRPSRPRTHRTVTSGANPWKQRPDEFRSAQFERTNRSRDARRWAFAEPAEKSLSTNSTNDTNDTNECAAVRLASVGSANDSRNRERAEKSLTAKSLNSRSPVHAMVTRRLRIPKGRRKVLASRHGENSWQLHQRHVRQV